MFEGYKTGAMGLSESSKLLVLLGDYMHLHYGPYHYAKASTAISHMADEYNKVLDDYDVIIMPTLTNTPCKIPNVNAPITEKVKKALDMDRNAAIFDVTGHPALSLNCGFDEEFPVGLMVVGKQYDDVCVLNVASILESVFKQHLVLK